MAKNEQDKTESLENAIAMLAQLVAAQQNSPGGITAAQMADLLEASRKAANPSNPTHPQKSVFSHPEGNVANPKGALDRLTYFCGSRQSDELLTPAEIDAFNALTESREARAGDWKVIVTPRERNVILPAATRDQREDLPNSLLLILKELAEGSEAVDPLALTKKIQEQEQKMLELEARLSAAGA